MSALLRFIGLCLGAVLTIGCDGADRPPLLSPPPPPGGLIVLRPDIIRIELIAPPEIAPGESVQLTANAIKSDGSAENVSNRAEWTTNDTSVIQVSSTGLATGKNRGGANVYAYFAGRHHARADIFVRPKEGTIPQKFAALAGVYDLTMTVEVFDPAWGDITGHRYSGVLTLVDGAGSFSEMRGFNAAGENVFGPSGGFVLRGVNVVTDRPVLLVGTNIILVVESIGEPEQGQTASPRFAGNFGIALWRTCHALAPSVVTSFSRGFFVALRPCCIRIAGSGDPESAGGCSGWMQGPQR